MQFRRKTVISYSLPAAVVAAIGLGAAVPSLSGAAVPPSLPAVTAQQLLATVIAAKPADLSGSLAWTANLGLSNLSSVEQDLGGGSSSSSAGAPGTKSSGGGAPAGSDGGFSPVNLLAGDYDLNVWLDGTTAEHLALIDGTDEEVDLVRNGAQAWLWDSATNSVTHYIGQQGTSSTTSPSALPTTTAQVPLTPGQLAARFLDKSAAHTSVTVGQPLYVAGQPAYQLLASPVVASSSTVDHIEVDVAAQGPLQGVVLQVAVYAVGQTAPALELGFTSVTAGMPPAGELTFTPPPGASVTTQNLSEVHRTARTSGAQPATGAPSATGSGQPIVNVVGRGWGAILAAQGASGGGAGELGELKELTSVVQVGGQSARLFTTSLLNVLFMPNGHIYAGLVTPQVLEAAATQAASAAAGN